MPETQAEFHFEDDQVIATVNGTIIAKGDDLDRVEKEAKAVLQPRQIPNPTHVVTPNGVKGKILSKTASLWGDVLTVKYENGQIDQVQVTPRTQFTTEFEKVASVKPTARFSSVLEASYDRDRVSLSNRIKDLRRSVEEARNLIVKGASVRDTEDFHSFIVLAENEINELRKGIEYLDDTEGQGYQPYKPEQEIIQGENIGHKNDGSWLDYTLNEYQTEAENTDFDKLLDEGPTLFVSEQEDATLEDAGNTELLATSFVQSKTAGLNSEHLDEYENIFLARTEQARRIELARRTVEQETIQKEAAQEPDSDAPIESLFF